MLEPEVRTACRMGFAAAVAGTAQGVAYLAVVVLLVARGAMPPPEPWATFVAGLLLTTVPTLVALMLALCWIVAPAGRPWAVLAAAFTLVFAVFVATSRLVQISVLRARWAGPMPPELALWHPYQPPSVGFTLEIAGWGLWLGLAFLAAAAALSGPGRRRALRWVLAVSGVLSVVAGFAPLVGRPELTTPGIVAWGPGLLAAAVLLAREFQDRLRAEPAPIRMRTG